MKIIIIVGTRPEIVKMAPVIKELGNQGRDYFILHTGQHYSYRLDRVFFEQLELPPAKYNLEVGSGLPGEQTARILTGVENILQRDTADIVLAEGDTNSVLAGVLAAVKLHIKVGHVEAGLRSYDRSMPEEINRIVADHCADFLFAPTPTAQKILMGEGVPATKIFVTGNTIVDAIYQNREIAKGKADALDSLGLKPERYFLVTIHRQENVDNRARFASILEGLNNVADAFDLPVVYPTHPHAQKRIAEFNLQPRTLRLVEAVDYFSFLQLESRARLILTDSGGIQEEACILGIPCVTLRDNTERPETLEVGSNLLAGVAPDRILEQTRVMLGRQNKWRNPFGDGTAGKRIVKIITGGSHG